MKNVLWIAILTLGLTLAGCGGEDPSSHASHETAAETSAAADSVTTETHAVRGVIVDRDPVANTLKLDHEAIGDWMGAMTMSFPVRGADVGSLPVNGTTITGTIHVAGSEFWLSDVAAETAPETATAAPSGEVAAEPAD